MQTQETMQIGESGKAEAVTIASLADVSANMRVDLDGDSLATIVVDRGRVWVDGTGGHADVIAVVRDAADFNRILRGDLNPVVGVIQGRILFRGNPALATRIILALNAAKPFGPRLPPLSYSTTPTPGPADI